MAKEDHCGRRSARKVATRKLELGYYYIVTDTTETEKNYFDQMRKTIPKKLAGKIEVRVSKTRTDRMVDECLSAVSLKPQYSQPWIVFDRDRVTNFDQIIQDAEAAGLHVGWSNPCFEIFLFAYYGEMPAIRESKACCQKFGALYEKKTGQEYKKADPDLRVKLCRTGDEAGAVHRAARRYAQHIRDGICTPSEMCPCTTVDQLVAELLEKTGA